jgi:tetratricopeptide (TPR) repeat protein
MHLRRWPIRYAATGWLYLVAAMLHGQSVAPSPAGSTDIAAEHEFQAAMAAEDKGDLDQAASLLLDLHRKHPGNFAVDESLGLIYVAGEKFAEALPLLQAAAQEQPASDIAHANLGAAYFNLHRNSEALAEFEGAAKINPENTATQQALGQLWMEAHQPDRAAQAFSHALALSPGTVDLQLSLAQALSDANQTGKAAEILASIKDADQSATAQSLLGDIAEKSGAYRDAAQHYIRASQLDPSESNIWALGLEFLRHWTFDAAVPEFEAAVVKFPFSTRMKLGLGAAYFGNGSYGKALPVFAELLESYPDNSLYAEMLGQSCTAVMQETQQRCALLLHYADAHPNDAKAATYAAATLISGVETPEQTQRARKLLEHAIAIDPKLGEARYQLGLLKQNESDWTGSISDLEAAVALKPTYAKAHYRLALAYWRSGRKQDGEAEIELEKKYAKQDAEDLDQQMRQITRFLVDVHSPK